ncbi:DUF3307 domain-containing protein [Aquimarina brevivitae]|uniref:Uncharacterized protein DUF3307 n=1 Tax=Aquimarina brevivitae TaxID=323412 RepID=A0A4Q7P1W5_9FLAO|nr:DUF3307 domain-containing protein [Aquimarina brevivitae]RZS93724.1 uncharacterized protein DUF3307 [Aquimarina brevivitae]
MLSFFFKLLLSHLVGDFLLQPTKWVEHKTKKKIRSPYLYVHLLVHFCALVVILQTSYWVGIFAVIGSHYLIDLFKLYFTKPYNERLLFIIDQLLHILVLVGVSYYYYPQDMDLDFLITDQMILFFTFLIVVTYAGSVIIKYLIAPWDNEIEFDNKSIPGAGKYIGILERLFVFSFVLLGTWSAIGFLITAKSVFRFGDLNEGKNRKLTEYVLIGTLLSFGIAILSGLLYNYCLTLIK